MGEDVAVSRLQKQGWETMNHYADAKTALISEMTARAEAWGREQGVAGPVAERHGHRVGVHGPPLDPLSASPFDILR